MMARVSAEDPNALILSESWITVDPEQSVEEYYSTLPEARVAFEAAIASGRFEECGLYRWVDDREGWSEIQEWSTDDED